MVVLKIVIFIIYGYMEINTYNVHLFSFFNESDLNTDWTGQCIQSKPILIQICSYIHMSIFCFIIIAYC